MLIEEVEFWWIGMKQMMEDKGEDATWENFKVRFLEEYFLDSVSMQKKLNSCSWNKEIFQSLDMLLGSNTYLDSTPND